MTNIIKLPVITKLDLQPDEMLRNIADSNPANVFVLVWPEDGSAPTYHSSTGDTPVVLMRLQSFIHKMFNGDFGEDGDRHN